MTHSSIPNDVRKRIIRFIDGDLREVDLIRIFEWLRFKTLGRAPFVKDIGDLVAHRDERDQGFTWARGRDFCHSVSERFSGPHNEGPDAVITLRKSALANYRILGQAEAQNNLHISYKKAKKILNSALSKIVAVHPDSSVEITEKFTLQEEKVFTHYSQKGIAAALSHQDQLMSELTGLLQHYDLLLENEIPGFIENSPFFAMFVICHMHGSKLKDEDGIFGSLNLSQYNDKLAINVEFPLHNESILSTPIYDSGVLVEEGIVHSSVIEANFDGYILEIGNDGKLVAIT